MTVQNPGPEPQKVKRSSEFNYRQFLAVILLAVSLRALLWFAYQPVPYSDTNSYRRSAIAVIGRFAQYDGTRTPGYPVFITFFDPENDGWENRTWLAQMALGVVVTGLFYYLGWQATGSNWVGIVMGLAYTLNLQQLFFEANLLTEALTTFLLTLTVVGMALWIYHPTRRSNWLAFGIGLAASLTAIVRPLFIFLPVWVIVFFVVRVESSKIKLAIASFKLQQVIAAALPALMILSSWVYFIHTYFGNWSLTTMTGYHMIQHTGEYFEYVPDEYAALRDTFIHYRDTQIAEHGTPTNAIWEAIPAMTEASGLGFYDLSDKLAELSADLIRQHPDQFLANAASGWWMFWRAPVYWSVDALRWPGLAPIVRTLVMVQRVGLFACNLAFIALSLWSFMGLLFKRIGDFHLNAQSYSFKLQPSTFALFIATTIWICSILQTLLDHGDNPRFLVPLQTFVILWLLISVNISKSPFDENEPALSSS